MTELLRINFEMICQRLLEKYTLEDIFAILDLTDETVMSMFRDQVIENIDNFDILCATDFVEEDDF
jgi:hypothetical protein